jgi:hypothetical protein
MYKSLLYTLLLAIFIIGCAEPEPKEPETPPPPPPPTPEEVAQTIIGTLALNGPMPMEGSTIPTNVAQQMISETRRQTGALGATPDGQLSLSIVSKKVDSRLRKMYNNEHWSYVFTLAEMHLLLNPGSPKFDVEKQRAVVELSRPIVIIKGILHDGTTDRPLARLQMFLPMEGRTVMESMKQGDIMYNIRFVEVIGSSQGIVFEYLATGEMFEVLTKAASR